MVEREPGAGGLTRRALVTTGAALAGVAATARAAQLPARATVPPVAWDRAPTLPLWPNGTPGGGFAPVPIPAGTPAAFARNVEQPRLHVFTPASPNGHALLCIPGGAYTFVSTFNEGWQVAERLNPLGITVFVLVYRLPGEGWADRSDVPLQDAQRAMRIIRQQAARWRIDPARVDAVGFSAGGHLAATLATAADERVYTPRDAADRLDAAPRRCGLIYPVITHEAGIGHAESTRRLLGDAPTAAAIERRSPAAHVGARTPPLFLMHAFDDGVVPPENTLLILAAMRKAGRPVEAHLFERGGHGCGPGQRGTPAGHWLDVFADWLNQPL